MVHRNAPLSETGRLRLARCVVDEGWPLRRAAERFQVSHTTAARWAGRYRQAGATGMADRSSRPHASPARTARRTERRIIKLRVTNRLGPAWIGFRLGLAPSTVHAVLARYGCPRLAHLDRATGVPVRRYERNRPGELVHVDVKKLGNIPDGGGWRVLGKARGHHNHQVHRDPAAGRNRSYQPVLGYGEGLDGAFEVGQILRWGWVMRALPDAELDNFVDTMTARLASFDRTSLASAKSMVNRASLPPDADLAAAYGEFAHSLTLPGFLTRAAGVEALVAQKGLDFEYRMGEYIGIANQQA